MKNKTKVHILILTLFSLSIVFLNCSTVLVQAEQVEAQFVAEKGGYLVDENGEKVQTLKKKVSSGTSLKEAYPEVKPDKDYKFDEWENPNKGNNEETIHSVENVYTAKFFPDLNDNDVDDRKEKVKLQFDSDTGDSPTEIEAQVGETVQLPQPKRNDAIFSGWFQDSDFKKSFTENDRALEDMTLYAKWQEVDEITKEGETLMIRNRSVSDQVEKRIADRYVEKVEAANKEIEKSKQDIKDAKETIDEVIPMYKNVNAGNLFMVKFFNENEEFLFSIVVPYGRTVKIMDDAKKKKEEYAVRQTTTLVLNSKDFITGNLKLKEYDVRNVESNSIDITEVFPVLEEQEQINTTEGIEQESDKKFDLKTKYIIFGSVAALLLILIVGIYMLKKPRKKNRHNPDSDTDTETELSESDTEAEGHEEGE